MTDNDFAEGHARLWDETDLHVEASEDYGWEADDQAIDDFINRQYEDSTEQQDITTPRSEKTAFSQYPTPTRTQTSGLPVVTDPVPKARIVSPFPKSSPVRNLRNNSSYASAAKGSSSAATKGHAYVKAMQSALDAELKKYRLP